MPTLFEFAGGEEPIHRLEDTFFARVLEDPLLQPLFGAGKPEHVDVLRRPRPVHPRVGFRAPDRRASWSVHHRAATTTVLEFYMAALDDSDLPAISRVGPRARRVRDQSRDAELERHHRRRATSVA
ncbi:hypothetical protein [Antrihabitans cavernicola]|uniref:hypothetical protein n=1 Tax=Antrihabitans cavernicola TaxID=2495913 RepID=UPI001BE41816|nr:hypothetical protein [Spelaeibacter cavernicola]